MLNGANAAKHNKLKCGMAKNYVTGTSKYPKSPELVLRIMNAYQPPPGWNMNQRKQEAGARTNEGATMFAQTGDDSWKADIECYKCGKKGHLAWECPKRKPKEAEQMHANIAVKKVQDLNEGENIFFQSSARGVVNRNYVHIDNQSTVNQIANPSLLANIRKAKSLITVHCNNGSLYKNLEGDLGGITMYHNPYGIANTLSMESTKAKHRVTYDSWDCDGVFKVHTKEGIVEFEPSEKRLHYHDTLEDNSNFECMLVNTVRDNFEGHTKRNIAKAKEAQRLQGMMGNPTDNEFKGMVHERLITNCPVTVQDVENANNIFGPDLANLREKMIRTKPEHVRIEYLQIPQDFVELHKYVTLVADVMFVNGLPFLVTSLQGISLVTIEYLKLITAKRLIHTLERVTRIYGKAGFIVQTALMDMEFEKLRDKLPNVILNTTAAQEHVGEIKRKIQVVKERTRSTISILPYKLLSKLMIIKLMHFCVM